MGWIIPREACVVLPAGALLAIVSAGLLFAIQKIAAGAYFARANSLFDAKNSWLSSLIETTQTSGRKARRGWAEGAEQKFKPLFSGFFAFFCPMSAPSASGACIPFLTLMVTKVEHSLAAAARCAFQADS